MPRPHITVDTDLDIPGTVALGMWVSQGWLSHLDYVSKL